MPTSTSGSSTGIAAEELRANVALKLTHLGLSFDEELAYANVERLVDARGRLGTFIRIDMEQSEYRRPHASRSTSACAPPGTRTSAPCSSPTCTGRPTTSSACSRSSRTSASSRAHTSSPRRSPIRRSRTSTAPTSARRARAARRRLRRRRDARRAIIRHVQAFAEREGIGRDRFEFQMLYGVRPALQRSHRGPGSQGARRDAVRPRLVPVPHAPARRAPREPRLLPPQPRPPMTALPRAGRRRRRRGRRDRHEHRLPPRRGRRRRLPARTRRARVRLDEPGRGRHPDAVLRSAEHRDRAPQHRGVHALRRAARGEIDFRQVGYLFLLDRRRGRRRVRAERRDAERARSPRAASSTLNEAARLSPLAGLDGVLAATFCPLDGHASPEAVAQGYAAGARRHGAAVLTGCAGHGHRGRGGR